MTRPPRLAEWLLLRRLAPDERDELLGDIREQFTRRAAARGPASARRWYWRQALGLAWSFSLHRRDIVSTAHDRTRGRWALDTLRVDVRYAWRSLTRSRSFAAVALLTLTLGVGLSTAMFSLVNAILLDPLPYAHADRLVHLVEHPASATGMPNEATSVSDTAIGAWLSTDTAIEQLSPYDDNPVTVLLPTGADNLFVTDVARDFFHVLSMPPLSGRVLDDQDFAPAAPLVAVISERLARRVFGGPQAALGQAVNDETRHLTIVGVLPTAFAFPHRDVDIWRVGTQYRRFPAPGTRRNFAMRTTVVGRLKAGATIADANRSGIAVGQLMVRALAASGDDHAQASTFEARRLLDEMVAPVRPALLLLGGTAGVLIAVCVNLANLLLARNTARQRDIALRLALGASRWRIGRPILIELLLLSSAGGAGGAWLAWWMLRSMPALAPASFPRIENIHFDVLTLAFAAGASLLTALAVGWLPTLQMPRTNVQELTSTGGRIRVGRLTGSADALRALLVGAQVALAVALLVTAILIGRSFQQLLHVDLGYSPEGVLTFQAAQPFANARQDGRLRSYFTALLDRLQTTPAIASAGFAAALPMHPVMIHTPLTIVGREGDARDVSGDRMAVNQPVSADFLRTVGTRIVKGRGFSGGDTAFSEKVALIDEVLERHYFPEGDAIGHQISWAGDVWRIVGVAETMHIAGLRDAPQPVLYLLTDQMKEFLAYARPGGGIAVRTAGDPRALIPFVREAARAVDPTVPLYNVQPLTDDISVDVAQPRFFTIILGLFATLALSTALLGVYGVLAYAVERRRLEFGIRRALGASEGHVIVLILRRGLALAAAGIGVGLAGAAAGTHALRVLLFGVTPADPVSFAGAAALVLLVVLAASWQPVRRALRIDPARALRVE